ncbi:MAG TPA: M50 family metallopeptidase [Chthoniobacterales bacterium]|nr:M50 family metallopeptidase [Chthoniobacterales bacterium]
MGDDWFLPGMMVFALFLDLIAWPYLAIFIHEFGHAAAAKLVGLSPTHFIVGYPDEDLDGPLFSFQAFGCAVECWPLPWGGATLFSKMPTDRLKLFFIAIAGPLMDVLVIVACGLLWRYTFIRLGLFFVIVSQSLNVLCNLIPRSIRHDGVCYPNDSKIVLQLLVGKQPAISGPPES